MTKESLFSRIEQERHLERCQNYGPNRDYTTARIKEMEEQFQEEFGQSITEYVLECAARRNPPPRNQFGLDDTCHDLNG